MFQRSLHFLSLGLPWSLTPTNELNVLPIQDRWRQYFSLAYTQQGLQQLLSNVRASDPNLDRAEQIA